MRKPVVVLLLTLAAAAPCAAQSVITPPLRPDVVNLSGPRYGVTTLSEGIVEKLAAERNIIIEPMISQFGWQFEKQST